MILNTKLEKQLLALLIQDKTFASTIIHYLSEEAFSYPLHKFVFGLLKAHYEKYDTLPTSDALLSTVIEKRPNFSKVELEAFAKLVFEVFEDRKIPDAAFLKDNVRQFVQLAVLRNAICKAGVLVEQGKVEEIYESLEKTRLAASSTTDAFKDLASNFQLSLEFLKNRETQDKISTGMPNLDIALNGGLCIGELGVVLGGVNTGKSMLLDNLALNASKNNKRVLLISLELSEVDTFARIASCLLRVVTNNLFKLTQEDLDKVMPAFNSLKEKLYISAYPTKSLGIQQIGALVKRFEVLHGKLDLLILDSADNLRTRGQDLRIELGDMYQRLRGICGENKIALWTCSQVNRQGMQAYRVRDIHTSESIDKIFTADVVVTLSQSESEYPDSARLFIAKSRRTQKYHEIPLFLQYDMAMIQEQPGFRLTQTLSADQVIALKNSLGIVETPTNVKEETSDNF